MTAVHCRPTQNEKKGAIQKVIVGGIGIGKDIGKFWFVDTEKISTLSLFLQMDLIVVELMTSLSSTFKYFLLHESFHMGVAPLLNEGLLKKGSIPPPKY